MSTPGVILLTVPWGLLGSSSCRIAIEEGADPPDTSRCLSPLLITEANARVFLNGDERLLEPFAEDIPTRGVELKAWDIPVALHAAEAQTFKVASWRQAVTLNWHHDVDYPVISPKAEEDRGSPGHAINRLLGLISAQMRDFESALSVGDDVWERVASMWLDPSAEREPTMDILISHARQHRGTWANIVDHPRRLLSRQRELMPLSRVQELDVQCMQWLTRQPGNTLAERAGGRQRILGLTRQENRNTLENRVFLDLMVRSVSAAREYIDINNRRIAGSRRTRRTSRLTLVESYTRECRRIQAELETQGVSRQIDPVQPNYVLLHERRYHDVWIAREEMIRRERAVDELWRWQRRSWAEFCKMAVAISLVWMSDARHVLASPLAARTEHRRGHWIIHDDPLLVAASVRGGWVAEVLAHEHEVPASLRALCATAWARITFDAGEPLYLAVWALHSPGVVLDLEMLVESASAALSNAKATARVRGVLLCSRIEPAAESKCARSGLASACSFDPNLQLAAAIEHLEGEIQSLVQGAE